jgi:hypothetical protein
VYIEFVEKQDGNQLLLEMREKKQEKDLMNTA